MRDAEMFATEQQIRANSARASTRLMRGDS